MTDLERAGRVATELAQPKSGAQAQHSRGSYTARYRQIAALPSPGNCADAQQLANLDGNGRVMGDRLAIELHWHFSI